MKGGEGSRHSSHYPQVKCALCFPRLGVGGGGTLVLLPATTLRKLETVFPKKDTFPSVCLKFWIKCGGVQKTRLWGVEGSFLG